MRIIQKLSTYLNFHVVKASSTFLILLICICESAISQVNVSSQHNNLRRTGWNDREKILNKANVSGGNFGLIFSRNVDDQIYGQPLIISNTKRGRIKNLVFVSTVNNSVYAFDADNEKAATPIWHTNLTYNPDDSASYRPVRNTDMTGACNGNYQDFSGNIGIVSTPVIDTASGTMFLVARSVKKNGTDFVQYLHALDIATGKERPNSPVRIKGSITGTGAGSDENGVINFYAQIQNQRAGLLLYDHTVFICWASHCDWQGFHGWVMGYDENSLEQKYVANTTRNGGLGGIWMSGQAPAVDEEGNIYLTTGNGSTGSPGNPNDTANRSESLIKYSLTGGQLHISDFFTPSNYSLLNDYDLDYGVDGVLLLPETHLSLSGSKESYLYLIDNNAMGGTRADNSSVLQKLDVNASSTSTEKHLHGSPVYFRDGDKHEFVYAWAEGGRLKQFLFDRSLERFDTLNTKTGIAAIDVGMPGAMLSGSSDGGDPASGIIWAAHSLRGDANHMTVPGVLQAFDAEDVSKELWNSNLSSLRDNLGGFSKFSPPTIANGKVYVATFSGKLLVYGLNPKVASNCTYPLPKPWLHADIGYVGKSGDVCDSSNVFTLRAAGSQIGGEEDGFHYLYQQMQGDFDLSAKIESNQGGISGNKAGLMVRENLEAGSPMIFLGRTVGQQSTFAYRNIQNQESDSSAAVNPAISANWFRLKRSSNTVVAYGSEDGLNWKIRDSVVLAFGTSPYIGVASTSGNFDSVSESTVSSLRALQIDSVLSASKVSLSVRNVANKVARLTWKTSGLNADKIIIERSGSTSQYQKIAEIPTTEETDSYQYNDVGPLPGINYYRLGFSFGDAGIFYTDPVKAFFNLHQEGIYPNPASGFVHLVFDPSFIHNNQILIEIFNSYGLKLLSSNVTSADGSTVTLDLTAIRDPGMHYFRITNYSGEQQYRKVLIFK